MPRNINNTISLRYAHAIINQHERHVWIDVTEHLKRCQTADRVGNAFPDAAEPNSAPKLRMPRSNGANA